MRDDTPRYTRETFPTEYRDLSTWPDIDLSALDDTARKQVDTRRRALSAYLAGSPAGLVARECHLSKAEILRHLNRCARLHPDGRIYGWRALLPHEHVEPYVRTASVTSLAGPAGFAGALQQFMNAHPTLRDQLDHTIRTSKVKDAIPESRLSHRGVYTQFLRLCHSERIAHNQYPLNTADGGRRALRRYARQVLLSHFVEAARQLGGEDAHVRTHVGTGHEPHLKPPAPFEFVSIDAHRLNFIGCIGIPTHEGVELLPIHRLQFIPVIEHASTAVLGYHVAIAREVSASDVVEAVKNALTPWHPRTLVLPGHAYPEGAALPSGVIPKAAGLCWSALLIDNASVHYSTAVATRLRERLGCALNYGPVRQWYRRPLVEALFSSLSRAGFLRLPNSTGTHPTDPKRPHAARNAVKYAMLWEEMLDLIDIIVCTYNGTPRESLRGLSPLERLQRALDRASDTWMPRTLPPLPPSVPEMDVTVVSKRVRGSITDGRRPFIEIAGVHYTNDILSTASSLIGTQIRVHVRYAALQTVKAFFPSGAEIGTLIAGGCWGHTPHDRQLRRNILRALEDRTLVVPPGTDVIQAFLTAKATQALRLRSKESAGRPRISPAATELARATRTTGRIVPAVSLSHLRDPQPPVHRIDEVSLPSFLGEIRHHGQLK